VSTEENYAGMAEREKYFSGLGKRDKRWNGSGSTSSGGGVSRPLKTSEASNKPAVRRVPAKTARPTAGSNASAPVKSKELDACKAELAEKEEAAADLQLNVDALEKERDFYFGKLRDIEILCQERETDDVDENMASLIDTIKKIMYATDDAAEEGEQAPEEAAEEVDNDESY